MGNKTVGRMLQFKYWIAQLLNALLGEIALLQHAHWVFNQPYEAKQLVEKRLSQMDPAAMTAQQ